MAEVISFREASEKARSDARSALVRLREERMKARREARPRWVPGTADAPPEAEPAAPAIAEPAISAPEAKAPDNPLAPENPPAPAPAKRAAKVASVLPPAPPGADEPPPAPAPRRKGAPAPVTGRGKRIADIVRDTARAAGPAAASEPAQSAPYLDPAPTHDEASPDDRAPDDVAPEDRAGPDAPEAPAMMLDLSVISLLGPGLRWRLSQLGIDTLKSLSKADAAWLRGELGEIGRLTNVEAWIEAAKAMDRPQR